MKKSNIRKQKNLIITSKISEGMTSVSRKTEESNLFGFINSEGKLVIPIIYSVVWDFKHGMSRVKKDVGFQDFKWGFINKENETIIPFEYEMVWSFNNGIAKIRKDYIYGYINKNGKTIDS